MNKGKRRETEDKKKKGETEDNKGGRMETLYTFLPHK